MSHNKRYFRIEGDGSLTPLEQAAIQPAARQTPDAKTLTPQQKEAWVHQTFEGISERYDLMNDLESFGLHRTWKHVLITAATKPRPQAILDVASGTGDIALALARALPQAQITGFDFSKNMLDVARKRASKLSGTVPQAAADANNGDESAPSSASNPSRLHFVQGNAMDMPFEDASFDVVTISFGLRNMPDYQRVIEEMTRVLRPGGCFLCLEASYPTAPVVKPLFRTYFRHVMPWMATLVTRKRAEYRWLNDSTEAFLSKSELAALMERCGLSHAHYRSFAFGAAALHTATKPDTET
jgi:demethylmenaquinone methyltransferase/2-methoxy-6-polyprenyl-1,4-benzoquinol methylase